MDQVDSEVSRYGHKESFTKVPHWVECSLGYEWLPHFAEPVLRALTRRCRGYNNGQLSITELDARRYGLRRKQLQVGLRALEYCGLIVKTRKALQGRGYGRPALWALSWLPVPAAPELGIEASDPPSASLQSFTPDCDRPRTIAQAQAAIGLTPTAGRGPMSDAVKARLAARRAARFENTPHAPPREEVRAGRKFPT